MHYAQIFTFITLCTMTNRCLDGRLVAARTMRPYPKESYIKIPTIDDTIDWLHK